MPPVPMVIFTVPVVNHGEDIVARVLIEESDESVFGQLPVVVRPLHDGAHVQEPCNRNVIRHELAQRRNPELV